MGGGILKRTRDGFQFFPVMAEAVPLDVFEDLWDKEGDGEPGEMYFKTQKNSKKKFHSPKKHTET